MPHHYSDSLIGALMLFGMLSILPAKLLYAAWEHEETNPISKLQVTQRLRYTHVALAVLSFVLLIGGLFVTQGVSETFSGLSALRNVGDGYGWALTVLFYFGLTIPIWAALVTVYIYRHPSELAYKMGRKFAVRTVEIRASRYGGRQPRIVNIRDFKLDRLQREGRLYGPEALEISADPTGLRTA